MCLSIFIVEYKYSRTLCDSDILRCVLETTPVTMEAVQMIGDKENREVEG